jgi:hypothetical protein
MGRMVSFISRTFNPIPGVSSRYPLHRRLNGPRAGLYVTQKWKVFSVGNLTLIFLSSSYPSHRAFLFRSPIRRRVSAADTMLTWPLTIFYEIRKYEYKNLPGYGVMTWCLETCVNLHSSSLAIYAIFVYLLATLFLFTAWESSACGQLSSTLFYEAHYV